MTPVKEKWDIIKNSVITEYGISPIAVKIWIDPMEYHSETSDTVTIMLPNDKAKILDLISDKYKDIFIIAISETIGSDYDVTFVVEESKPQDNSISLNNIQEKESTNTSLIKKYTFDNFVTGNNSFAVSACLAVAETAGTENNTYNPLYIYGGSGLGKTHLMHAIGNYINEHNPSLKILYVTSENFTNDVVNSLRSDKKYNTDSMSVLKDKYRNVDVLLIDDIQFVIGKEATQVEFFNTFNALYENGKSIIISSDKHPKYMEYGRLPTDYAFQPRDNPSISPNVSTSNQTLGKRKWRISHPWWEEMNKLMGNISSIQDVMKILPMPSRNSFLHGWWTWNVSLIS